MDLVTKRNDIGDSYLLWLLGSCDAGSASTQEDDHAALCWRALRTTVTYAGTPTIGNAQSLSFPFHSPGGLSKEGQRPRREAACLSLQLRGSVDDLVARQLACAPRRPS